MGFFYLLYTPYLKTDSIRNYYPSPPLLSTYSGSTRMIDLIYKSEIVAIDIIVLEVFFLTTAHSIF